MHIKVSEYTEEILNFMHVCVIYIRCMRTRIVLNRAGGLRFSMQEFISFIWLSY